MIVVVLRCFVIVNKIQQFIAIEYCENSAVIHLFYRVHITQYVTRIIQKKKKKIMCGEPFPLTLVWPLQVMLLTSLQDYSLIIESAKYRASVFWWLISKFIRLLWCFLFYQKMCTLFQKMKFRVCFLKMFRPLKGWYVLF